MLLSLHVFNLNYMRPHEGSDGKTPAEVCVLISEETINGSLQMIQLEEVISIIISASNLALSEIHRLKKKEADRFLSNITENIQNN